MLLTKEILTALSEMGLNNYESKVYLTLITDGISTAKNISDVSSIPYGKVYEIINVLASKGFVTVIPTKPMKYQAVSPEKVVTALKKSYNEKIEKFETGILKKLGPLFLKNKESLDPESILSVIRGRKNINNKIEDMMKKAKKQVYILTSENGMKRLGFYKELFDEINKKNIKIMIAGNINQNNLKDIKSLNYCEFRHIDDVPCHFFSIDRKESILIDPVPDDEDFIYGRDIAAFVSNSSFAGFLENSFRYNFSKAQILNERKDDIRSGMSEK